jgi:LEA14-like dessication related protein
MGRRKKSRKNRLLFLHFLGYDRKMKRFTVFLSTAAFFFLPSCMSWFLEQPTFALKEVAITRLSLTDIHFRFGIEVQNPNSFDLDLRGLEYTVHFNDREVGRGRLEKAVRVAKTSATLVQVPLQTDFKSLGDPLGLILAGQDLRYKIEGAAIVKASLGTATIPFSKSGEIKIKK